MLIVAYAIAVTLLSVFILTVIFDTEGFNDSPAATLTAIAGLGMVSGSVAITVPVFDTLIVAVSTNTSTILLK